MRNERNVGLAPRFAFTQQELIVRRWPLLMAQRWADGRDPLAGSECVFCPYSSRLLQYFILFYFISFILGARGKRLSRCFLCLNIIGGEKMYSSNAHWCTMGTVTPPIHKHTLYYEWGGKKKQDFHTKFISGKKSVDKKLLREIVIYDGWHHSRLRVWSCSAKKERMKFIGMQPPNVAGAHKFRWHISCISGMFSCGAPSSCQISVLVYYDAVMSDQCH